MNKNIIKIPNFITPEEVEMIKHEILSNEEKIKSMGDNHTVLVDGDSLTGRYWCYNFITNNTVVKNILYYKLLLLFGRKRFVKCWANTYREGQGFKHHVHRDRYDPRQGQLKDWTCGHITIADPNHIGIKYGDELMHPEVGEFQIFPSFLPHSVPKNTSDDVRITLAMDVFVNRTSKLETQLK
tara:strand:+ start:423 stop:971 length:549 start_codon:yes stop_codon:yes gene_type:complete